MKPRTLVSAAGLLVLIVGLWGIRNATMARLQPEAQPLALSAQEATARAAALCDVVLPGVDGLRLETARGGTDGDIYWSVSVLDAHGRRRAGMTWDAKTGDLRAISRSGERPPKVGEPGVDRQTVLLAASQLLRTLGLTGQGEWTIDAVRQARNAHWVAEWHSGDRHGCLILHGRTGGLVMALSTGAGNPTASRLARANRPRAPRAG